MEFVRVFALSLSALWAFGAVPALEYTPPQPNAIPVNPNATPEARNLLGEIEQISGHRTLTGQHNFPNHVSQWSDRIYDLTGRFPAVFGQDFGFAGGGDKDSIEGRPAMIREARRQYRQGAVIALTWHAVRPTDDEPVTFRDSVQGHLTDFEWNELLTPGTNLYNRWVEQVDVIAGYLAQLQAAGVPVLFRPYHEMNGSWFWWGGRPGPRGSAALYRQLYDRFVNVHHLNNLVWVWNVNSPGGNAGPVEDYFPGAQYADVVTMDVYGEFRQSYYEQMLRLAGPRPIALAEVGRMPSLEVLARQPRWAYFMMWSELAELENTPEDLETIFHAPNLLNRGDAPFTAPAAAAGVIEPATRGAIPAAREVLGRLYAASGSRVLSGQRNDAGSPRAATESACRAAGRCPAVSAVDLGTGDGGRQRAVLAEVHRQGGSGSIAGSIVNLRWLPPNPAAADPDPRTPLSDFEWRELMTPGTRLHERWGAGVDAVAEELKQLEREGVALLWTPYPDPGGARYWWSGHPGIHGSAALYRMLFDRLVNRDGVHNLVWVWEVAEPAAGAGLNAPYAAYFPGLLYVDALELDVSEAQPRLARDRQLGELGAGKVTGLAIEGRAPGPGFFRDETGWAWFELAPAHAADAEALRSLYGDPHVASR